MENSAGSQFSKHRPQFVLLFGMDEQIDDVLFMARLIDKCIPALWNLFKKNWSDNEGVEWVDGKVDLWEKQQLIWGRKQTPKKQRGQGVSSWVKACLKKADTSTWVDTVLFQALLWCRVHVLPPGSDDRKDVLALHALRNAAGHTPFDPRRARYLTDRWHDETDEGIMWDSCIDVVRRFTLRNDPQIASEVEDLIQRKQNELWISPDNLTLLDGSDSEIGRGAASVVYKGILKLFGRDLIVAVKVWRSQVSETELKSELKVLFPSSPP